ncbi:uncharacterized protein FOMMEDRAFT_144617 [Fomitiporia mediterranea MF3/22]|uniref:uncharacterized protein n=1 Tax=Fomitiporia mediterranea (strain MF3/22) TaxID=694068 RepID=UPI00044080C2|nr:uncharacterized protein FOMMEDRAFT_144617 [Fomitiporia mediterranea MF3/22]EJD06674.1 hypothetical protein FOMMEDRAFT_144617 [Fomitiporia mediterranea MF3/22]
MATRSSTRAVASASASPAPPRRLAVAQPASTASPQLLELRRQWKWAALSQFFCTFAQLIALEDVSLVDIEEDLVNSTMIVIPRLMQRLLVTLTQDRKISVVNWQPALRRQYLRRDPAANPIGVEPIVSRNSRAATVEAEIKSEERESSWTDEHEPPGGNEQDKSVDENKIVNGEDGGNVEEPEPDHAVNESAHPSRHTSVGVIKDDEESENEQNAQGSIKDWAELSMLEKLDSIHLVTEWHFQNPLRLRSIMRSDDDNASWRIEPIGYDAKRNAYWYIGLDRLWIQRSPPKPPKKTGKRKAVSHDNSRKTKARRIEHTEKTKSEGTDKSSRTGKTSKSTRPKQASTPRKSGRGSRQSSGINDEPSAVSLNGRARAAKTQANVKLDLQAKQLAAAKAEMESFNRRSSGRTSPSKASNHQTLGTRVSRRLRGRQDNDDDDEWQEIPEEWLPKDEEAGYKSSPTRASGTRSSTRIKIPARPKKEETPPLRSSARNRIARDAGLESDDESELTELSDLESSNDRDDVTRADTPSDAAADAAKDADVKMDDLPDVATDQPPDFVEWETLCISLEEWEAISHRFEKATHYLEKALHKILVQEIVPYVTSNLLEIERQRAKEDALMNRKRSSRIAIKEMEKEAERLATARQAEEDEKMARMRRLEARARREEEERLRREQAREQRRKEREERELARSRRLERERRVTEDEPVEIQSQPESSDATKPQNVPSSSGSAKTSRPRGGTKANKRTKTGDWELDCEICGSKGINKAEGIALMSCGKCNKWQHIPCHDAVDKKAGRRLRNWDVVDFFCRRCLALQKVNIPAHASQTPRTSSNGNAPEHHSGSRNTSPMYMNGSPAAVNGVPANPLAINMIARQHHTSPGSSSFAGFAHYQPQQRGFSPHPSVLHPQHAQHPRTLANPTYPSVAGRGVPAAWEARPQNNAYSSQGVERGAYQLPPLQQSVWTTNGATNRHSPDFRQQHSIATNGPVPYYPAQTSQSPQPYNPPSQQKSYSNPASYHP